MTEREKFEAWANGQQPGTLDLTPFEDTYDSDFTSRAWDAWQARALLAAGASEGQADHPLDIRAYIVTDRSSGAKALKWAAELGNRFPSELYQLIPLTHHADAVAELTALRERIAGMEKDAPVTVKAIDLISQAIYAGKTNEAYKRLDDIRAVLIAKEPK